MSIVELKKRIHTPRDLVPLDKTSGAARYRAKMKRDIEKDLGGRRNLTRIELEQIDAYAGTATLLKYLDHQILLGDDHDVDPASYAKLASTMLRIGSKLGINHSAKEVDPYVELEKAAAKREEENTAS